MKQKKDTNAFSVVKVENVGDVKALSLYDDAPVSKVQAVAEATKIGRLFNMEQMKVDLMAEIFFEDRWTVKKIRDAVKSVLKENIYNTSKVGIEPGKILSYDKQIKFYTLAQVLNLNKSMGTAGFKAVPVPGLFRTTNLSGTPKKTNVWFIKESDLELFKKIYGDIEKIAVVTG